MRAKGPTVGDAVRRVSQQRQQLVLGCVCERSEEMTSSRSGCADRVAVELSRRQILDTLDTFATRERIIAALPLFPDRLSL